MQQLHESLPLAAGHESRSVLRYSGRSLPPGRQSNHAASAILNLLSLLAINGLEAVIIAYANLHITDHVKQPSSGNQQSQVMRIVRRLAQDVVKSEIPVLNRLVKCQNGQC